MNPNRGATIVLNWLSRSRAQRIAWLLEELNLSYTIQPFKRNANGTAPAEMKQIHPLGKSPTISIQAPDTSLNPIILAETSPIMAYLIEHFANEEKRNTLVPEKWIPGKEGMLGGETEEWMRWRYFDSYVEGSLMGTTQVRLVFDAVKNAPLPFFIKPVTNLITSKVNAEFLDGEFRTHFGFLENQLATPPGGGGYICGRELTTADIQLSVPLAVALGLGVVPRGEFPLLNGYVERLQREEGYRRAVERVRSVEGDGKGFMLE
ncbi:glutathione S-transferase [Aspergillus sclerotioniger CBS 115572]|uniref:Glutathione S-transferase n=1 Tax=Aspergillus sclerotioniger CBS 115572 TaxID=1450535 RepID=A0A317VT57_9EURO|nr:glutathione S-transferase [Aspergillus sclerotioniger CBS 115572]PWY76122.1 glutathione S-transferase [Aspergillus sclerotioniger CBS 115572]